MGLITAAEETEQRQPKFTPSPVRLHAHDETFVDYGSSTSDIIKHSSGSAEERFRHLVEAVPCAAVGVDDTDRITFANAQTEAIFGYREEELIGKNIEVLLRAWSRSPRSMRQELVGRHRDGRDVPVEVTSSSWPVLFGSTTETFVFAVDILQRKRIEQEHRMQRNELAHLSRVAMLGELTGSLAHELNQPLTAILSNAQAGQEFLRNGSAGIDEVRSILQDIVSEDRRAGEVIRRLRLLFRKGEVQFDAINVNDLVMEVLKLMRSDLVNHDVAVQTELAEHLPPVNGDRIQLQQVLINLIMNAFDAMPEAQINERRLTVGTAVQSDGDVEIRVSDTGSGIPVEHIEQIFEAFHTTKSQGIGLGLTVCKMIMSSHSGKLWASNNAAGGASFHVTLAPMQGVHT